VPLRPCGHDPAPRRPPPRCAGARRSSAETSPRDPGVGRGDGCARRCIRCLGSRLDPRKDLDDGTPHVLTRVGEGRPGSRAATRDGAERGDADADTRAGANAGTPGAGSRPELPTARRQLRRLLSAVPATRSFPALGTTATVAVTEPPALDAAVELLRERLEAVDLACSRFRAESELAWVNAHAGVAVQVSPLLARSVRIALDAARSSDGCVDPTLGSQLRGAGYDRTFALVRARGTWQFAPSPARRAAWKDVRLDEERTLLVPEGVQLDLGATAKALAADDAARALAAAIGAGVLISLGGDIAIAGAAPPGGWSVRIADDHAAPVAGPGPTVAITVGGLATSSTAVRRWQTDRGEAHHILDPRSGRPAVTPWRTVTVAAGTCVDANVAATASVVLGADAVSWLVAARLPARLVRDDDSVVAVAGWPADEERAA
jgi:FAD:protein FMN transferase